MTPRERFVDAMQEINTLFHHVAGDENPVHQAVEAFADAECRAHRTQDGKGWWSSCIGGGELHDGCRTDLLRECGMEVSDERLS